MDFDLDEEQAAIASLAGQVLGDLCAPELLRAHEASGEPYLAKAWTTLAEADLLGIALPEAAGGGGYGVLEAALVAEQVGRHVAPVPYLSTIAGALVLAGAAAGEHGDLLRGVAAGTTVLAPAHVEQGVATPTASGGRLTGEVPFVPWAAQAHHLLVPADDGLHLVDPGADGVTIEPEDAAWGLPQATVSLAGAAGRRVGGPEAVEQLRRVATALTCSCVAGVCEGAVRITAAYVSDREQFGTKIGTFQAVAQRIADAFIDAQAVHLTSRQAAWRMAAGLPADDELAIAKFWAADAGHRVVHAAQHLHGGVGVDVDYAVHRYFRWAKVLELRLGSGTEHLRRLGASIAATAV